MLNGSKKTIKIGFLFQQSENWIGGINYFNNLFEAITKIINPTIIPYIYEPHDKNAQILTKNAKVIKLKKDIKYCFTKILYKLNHKPFDKEKYMLSNINLDVISHTYQKFMNIPIISWIPDFQHIHLKEMFSEQELIERNRYFLEQAKNSKLIILSSYNALQDFKQFTPEYANKGRVLHFVAILDKNIYNETDKIKNKIIDKYQLPTKYFYVPNQFWKHKNHIIVFKAISLLKQQGMNINVIFSGNTFDYRNSTFFDELKQYITNNNLEDNIKILGIIDTLEVYYLMRNSISIINPSLFEGWSTTVEEAKSLGKNIILSNIAVHQEQNPPAATYFNPYDTNELADILKLKWLNNSFGPDILLEEKAKHNIDKRTKEFAQTYKQIVLEALS